MTTAEGKVLLVGTANDSDLLVIRLLADGSLDTTFNGTGWRTIDFDGGGQGETADLDWGERFSFARTARFLSEEAAETALDVSSSPSYSKVGKSTSTSAALRRSSPRSRATTKPRLITWRLMPAETSSLPASAR
ncbi:MAG: hypothetical protein U1D30_25375 [Planctomycetota bacterium]